MRKKVDDPAQARDICRQAYHFCLGKALQEGRATGATDARRFRQEEQAERKRLARLFAGNKPASEM